MSHAVPRLPRSAARVLLCATAAVLLGAAPASAAGLWPAKDVQRLRFEYGPITVKPGQNGIENVVLNTAKPKVDGFITRMRPDLETLDGKVPPVDVLHLHHGVWLNASGRSDASPFGGVEPIFFGGEEKTVFKIPRGYGYAYRAKDVWVLNHMIHNNTSQRTKVKLVWELDFIPRTSPKAKGVKAVTPLWMDVRRGWGYPVFDVTRDMADARGTFTFPDQAAGDPYAGGAPQNEFVLPRGGTLVSAVGHLHPGGLRDDIDLVRPGASLPRSATPGRVPDSTRIFRSQARYYDPAGPVSWDMSLTASRPDWRVRVRRGDTLRISATYEARRSAWYENMGIVLLFMARDGGGPDPFAEGVDWRGALTHGHLAENDNRGGKATGLPDPRAVGDGAVTQEIDIKDFEFVPGDLGLLAAGGKVPVVQRGTALTFRNLDDPGVVWHSITACRAPCNRSTGISYPLADGTSQFDSGQLGNGPAGLSPAANRLTWTTPQDLEPGTYTYFCRIHPFMRGAFRVR